MSKIVVVRGAGDLATGVICKLHNCGYKVIALEIERPLAIRRQVSFSEAVYERSVKVEGITCELCETVEKAKAAIENNKVALLIDEDGKYINNINPEVVVDAILAKRNLGTNKDMAPITIGLGPGFVAGTDVDIVIETMRGHNLGRIIKEGIAKPNTGIPGEIRGISKERVVYSPVSGIINNIKNIGDIVKKDETLCFIEDKDGIKHNVNATIDGVLRGLIRDGAKIKNGLKILDIDPRIEELDNCFTVSDKARCIAGGVVEAIMSSDNL